ncbi:sensor domain-containing diguanylate cyclase [Butyrivibrio sp. LC3010]|uniref:sensor domain-containing diguanylate cyclase n=1 Tax=Butyrivibrio sp. LC3010 TaxID=1280680 RepID=UPI0004158AD6|nr:diguanylate cyclase [Butyrivibrio sp. LC3010]
MKQLNYELTAISDVHDALNEVYVYTNKNPYKSLLFHLYTIKFTKDEIAKVQEEILEMYPDAKVAGTSSNGDICDGHLAEYGLVMSVSIFESTDISVYFYECASGEEEQIGLSICNTINETDKIKAAEILLTLKTINSTKVLSEVEKCKRNVKIFGGGSAGANIEETSTSVISERKISHTGVILITYSGDDIHVDIHHAIGWKPLGKELVVTKSEDKRLYELDNVPAGKIYSKYLDIQADDDFFANMLEFPLISKQHGYEVLRLPFSCDTKDDSIILAGDVKQGTVVSLSYGDPDVIKADVEDLIWNVRSFAPQAIFLYSCGVRRLYWKYLINKETGPFSLIAPVSGFYSSGEIMRMGDYIIEHHVTLIAIAMREGGQALAQPTGIGDKEIEIPEEQKMHGQLSMVRRLANFINVTSAELRAANDELREMADTDILTGLYNRRMLQRVVKSKLEYSAKYKINVIMGIIDIDDFKNVNDTYGHACGDNVLKQVAAVLREEIEVINGGICGRWGGEEFLFMLSNIEIKEALRYVDLIRSKIACSRFEDIDKITISTGITEYQRTDSVDSAFKRADAALYEAKNKGKNCTIVH